MDNNKISNPQKEVPNTIELNDKDYLNDLLSCLKEMEKNYTTAKTEASNEILYKEIKNMCEDIAIMQRKTYELMFKNGWYVLEKAETTKIADKYQMLNNEFESLSNKSNS